VFAKIAQRLREGGLIGRFQGAAIAVRSFSTSAERT
jgi:hypothetical protein